MWSVWCWQQVLAGMQAVAEDEGEEPHPFSPPLKKQQDEENDGSGKAAEGQGDVACALTAAKPSSSWGGDASALAYMSWPQHFRVLRPDADVFAEPTGGSRDEEAQGSSRPVGRLQQGAVVEVLGQQGPWVAIRHDPHYVREKHRACACLLWMAEPGLA